MKKLSNGHKIDRKYALTAGIALMVMTLAAIFSYGIVLERMIIDGDPFATYNNIQSSTELFTAGIMGWLIILISDIVVAWSLYIFLQPINNRLSLLGAWLRLIYAGILGVAILNLIIILMITKNPELFSSFKNIHLQSVVMVFLKAFKLIWSIGLIIFGGHLMVVGYLTLKSNFVPKVISILLLIGSISYIIIHFNYTFLSQYNKYTAILESILSVPMFLGEFSFGIWLLFNGGRIIKN